MGLEIHELNTFEGTPGANDYLATDNGNETKKISAEKLLAAVNTALQQMGVDLNGRIDNIIAGGAAPSAAEIIDARRGANGVNYPSLGEAIRGQNELANANIEYLTEQVGAPSQNVEIDDFTSTSICNVDGSFTTYGGNWVSTEYLPCNGATIKYNAVGFNSNGIDLAYVAFFDINKEMTHCLKSSDKVSGSSIVVAGEITADPGDEYVRVVGNTSTSPPSYAIIKATGLLADAETIQNFDDRINDMEDTIGTGSRTVSFDEFTSNEILREDGTFFDYGDPWKSTDYILCRGISSINYRAYFFHGTGVNIIASVAFFDENKNLISFIGSSDYPQDYSGAVSGTATVPSNAWYVRVIGRNGSEYLEFHSSGLKQFDNFKTAELNVLCIGDSLTSGVINRNVDIIRESYPYWVGQILSSDVANAGYPGGQPNTWWARKELYDQPTNDTDLVLIMFGTNGGLETNTLDTDVEPYTNYNDYANTGVGCMCKIIEWIMEETSNHAQIILLTPPMNWATTGTEAYAEAKFNVVKQTVPVVYAIAQRYALPVIDVFYESGMNKFNGSEFRPDDGIHFSAAGYHKLGTYIARKVASMYSTFVIGETGTII